MGKYDDGPYSVGKGKPPAEHRWKPGQSGNPNGRPSRPSPHQKLSEQLRRVGEQKVTVNVDGKPTRMTMIEALFQSTFVGLLNGSESQKLKAITEFERLGVFQELPENRRPNPEAVRKLIEKLAEEARREEED